MAERLEAETKMSVDHVEWEHTLRTLVVSDVLPAASILPHSPVVPLNRVIALVSYVLLIHEYAMQ